MKKPSKPHPENVHRLARRALFGFILTFILSRVMVFLIMAGLTPNMYFFLHGTHVHHLNYGIFLLSVVGGYSVFKRPLGLAAEITALLYGVGMGLTFDEFGMWLHLGGSYWQRASVDAVIVVAAIIALIAFAQTIGKLESRHLWAFSLLVFFVFFFVWGVWHAGDKIGELVGPTLMDLEQSSSP